MCSIVFTCRFRGLLTQLPKGAWLVMHRLTELFRGTECHALIAVLWTGDIDPDHRNHTTRPSSCMMTDSNIHECSAHASDGLPFPQTTPPHTCIQCRRPHDLMPRAMQATRCSWSQAGPWTKTLNTHRRVPTSGGRGGLNSVTGCLEGCLFSLMSVSGEPHCKQAKHKLVWESTHQC